jgi:PIN domain nuclease of toxin-antitoxin system
MSTAYLVDTNIILWSWHEPHRIRRRHRDILASDETLHVSVATIWEICIKVSIGKLKTVDRVADALIDTGYILLPIKVEHVEAVRYLPLHHGEPFDRLIIAQAQIEGMTLVSSDGDFPKYDVRLA